jgi:hypothetical protein
MLRNPSDYLKLARIKQHSPGQNEVRKWLSNYLNFTTKETEEFLNDDFAFNKLEQNHGPVARLPYHNLTLFVGHYAFNNLLPYLSSDMLPGGQFRKPKSMKHWPY